MRRCESEEDEEGRAEREPEWQASQSQACLSVPVQSCPRPCLSVLSLSQVLSLLLVCGAQAGSAGRQSQEFTWGRKAGACRCVWGGGMCGGGRRRYGRWGRQACVCVVCVGVW